MMTESLATIAAAKAEATERDSVLTVRTIVAHCSDALECLNPSIAREG